MEYSASELRGRGITNDALQTTLEMEGYKKLSEDISDNKMFFNNVQKDMGGGKSQFYKRHVGANLIRKKSTSFVTFDLVVSLFAKELITRANHDAVYISLTDFWDIMEGEEYNEYVPSSHTVLSDFQDNGPSPYVGKDGIRLRKRIEWTIMQSIKKGKAFTIATNIPIAQCDWYTEGMRYVLAEKLIKYPV